MTVYLISELSHNHNGDFDRARRMVEESARAGADAVKIQCRTLPDAIPVEQRDKPKVVPWTGETMPYWRYRALSEFTDEQIIELSDLAYSLDMEFFASVWDTGQIARLAALVSDGVGFNPPYWKIPSACATDLDLLRAVGDHCRATDATAILSTGGTTWEQVEAAVNAIGDLPDERLWLGQCTAIYPCPPDALNLRAIPAMASRYPHAVVGFSNHAASIAPMLAAVGLGAKWIEVHFTLSRTLPGTDHAASFEPQGLAMLRRYVDTATRALGDGIKVPTPGEVEALSKLRRVQP